MVGTSRNKIAVIAALSAFVPTSALPQQVGGVAVPGAAGPVVTPQASGGTIPKAGTALRNTGGLQFDFGVSSNLGFDDNFALSNTSAGTSTIWDSTLTFGLSNITPTQSLTLDASTILRFANIPGRTVSGVEDPTVRLRYVLTGLNSTLSVDGRYRTADREFLNPFQIEQEEQALGQLIGGGGVVTWQTLGATFVTGINDPLGFQISARHDERYYDATAEALSPTLFDQVTDSATATVTAKVSPLVQLRGSVGLTEYSAEDSVSTDRETIDYAIGAVMDINPVLTLDAQVGYTEVTTDTTGGRTVRSGTTSNVQLTQTLTNGSVFGGFTSTVNQNGTRNVVTVGRDFQLASGTLSATVGMTRTPAGNTRSSGSLAYTRTMRSSDISVTAGRSVTTNGLNQDVFNTRVGVNYSYAINNVSQLNLGLNWGRSESADSIPGFNETTRTDLLASYSHALTQDWGLTGGLKLRHRSDNTGDAQSNAIFLTLDRTFSYRP